MTEVSITDSLGATGSLKIRDDSPLAKAKLSEIISTTNPLLTELVKPISEANISKASFGLNFSTPKALLGDGLGLTVKTGVNGGLSIFKSQDGFLFPEDASVPPIPIAADECWLGIEVDTLATAKVAGKVDGFGIGVTGASEVAVRSFGVFHSLEGIFPALKDCLQHELERFGANDSPAAFRSQPVKSVRVTETSGSVKFKGSYTLPTELNAFASVDLPFDYNISLSPAATVQVAGEIAISGDFLIRSYRRSEEVLQLGLYKRKGRDFTIKFTAGAGIEAGSGDTDLITAVLDTALPGVDAKKAGLSEDDIALFQAALEASIDRSLAVAVNSACSASLRDEVAVVFDVTLSGGDPGKTDAALTQALAGDWSALDSLENAVCRRNVVTRTSERTHKLGINLLGFYNALSTEKYLLSCRAAVDEYGDLTLVDKAQASRVLVGSKPYEADREKLRKVLAESFLVTVTYAASRAGSSSQGLGASVTVKQTYFRYEQNMSSSTMHHQVLLGTALGLMQPGAWDGLLNAQGKFPHARIRAAIAYEGSAALSLFFADLPQMTPRSQEALEKIGREVLAALIAPDNQSAKARVDTLKNDTVWAAMDKQGGTSAFSNLPYFAHLNLIERNLIAADWADIVWWATAMTQVAPKLRDALSVASNTSDPQSDKALDDKRKALRTALGEVTKHARAAFADGWGLAVMYALADRRPAVTMKIGYGNTEQQYSSGVPVAGPADNPTLPVTARV